MKTTERIVAHVAANPGVRYADLCAAVGVSSHSGFVAYVRKTGRIFSAGPRSWQRYYPTAEQAWAGEAAAHAEAAKATRERNERTWQENNRRRKAASRLLGRNRNTRPKQAVQGEPNVSEFIVRGKRYVIPAKRDDAAGPPRVVNSAEVSPWVAALVGAR